MPYSRGETSRGSSPVIVVVTSFFVLLFCFLILIYACDHYCHHVWRGCAYNFADKRGVCYDQLDTLGPISRNGQWSRNGQEGRWGGVRCEVDPYVYAPQKILVLFNFYLALDSADFFILVFIKFKKNMMIFII